jgi:hypothetical protein
VPWHIESRDGKFCVIKDSDGHNQGCHDSRDKAKKQMAALYAKEDTMTAALAPLKPPRGWFEEPEANTPTPLTFTADGQVYGHLALYETCHTGFQGGAFSECVQAPRSPSGYQMFHLGGLETDDGTVAVGKLTYGTGHAPLSAGLQAASAHYDDTGSVGAFVRATDGRYGIWLAGAVRSDLTPEGLRDMRANPPSGDWRALNNQLELVAALSVVVPGFPVSRPQLALAASGAIGTLVLPPVDADDLYEPRSKEFLRRRYSLSAALARSDGD